MKELPANLPNKPWVYLFKDKTDNILYIGKAKNIQKRVQQYFSPWSVRKQDMVNKANSIDYITTQNETEALELEDNLIKQHKPPFNSLLRNNNYYVYIKITKEDFSQIFIVRKRKNDGATYIWPKYHSKELRNFLQFFRQMLKYRGCKITQFRQWKLCWDYYFWLCKWRCVKSPSKGDLGGKTEHKAIIKSIQKFFEGDTKNIENHIKQEIQLAIDKQHFERAAKLRDMLLHIDKVTEKQRVILDPKLNWYFFKLQRIWSRYVYAITHFFNWKLIDIITNKQTIEVDSHSILSSFSSDFWQSLTPLDTNFYSTTNSKKKTQKEINSLMDSFLENYIAKSSFEWENVMNDILIELQKRYYIKAFPYHIECIDISHFSGWRTSGWLSCFLWWVPYKYGYRRYKIKSEMQKHDDYAALEEVIARRFQHTEKTNETKAANLFILDWWKGQLAIIKKHFKKLAKTTTFISLGKWEARKRAGKQKWAKESIFYFDENFNIQSKELVYDQVDRILTHIRDESHRFANNYRKKQMSAEWK